MLWNILYIGLGVLVILALLQLFGLFIIPATLVSVLYVLLVITLVIAILHWVGLF